MSAGRQVTAMCEKAKSWLAFKLRCKDRKEAKFCRLPLLSVHDVLPVEPTDPKLPWGQSSNTFHIGERSERFTSTTLLQCFPFPGYKWSLGKHDCLGKMGGAELAMPLCKPNFPLGMLLPQTELLLQETAKCSSRSCQFPNQKSWKPCTGLVNLILKSLTLLSCLC